jgi:hypothetical protein
MSANPVANGGLLRKSLDMPDFRTLGPCALPGSSLCGAPCGLVRGDRQKVKEEREELRGEPPFGGASSFAGLGVPFLSGHVADLCAFSAWR